jgi:UDP-N-acetylmuramoylalanine--D-glutamate ligase
MAEGKSFSIHKSKKSLVDKLLTARESLVKTLEETSHRLEIVRIINEVEYINDSKSTDLLSTRDSLKCIQKPVIWIASTPPHDRDYALIEKYVKYKIKGIVAFSSESEDIRRKLSDMVENFDSAPNLKDAITKAINLAKKGDAILFSPSCASFDMYDNYIERGNAFKRIINSL